MNANPILAPVIALVLWSFVMWAWLYATRIPAIVKYKISLDPNRPASELQTLIPAPTRWKADNYNHLMEQPTLFYAVALTLAVIGASVHSLVQATVNIVKLRFAVFTLASLVLLALTVRAAVSLF